jgi:transcriptional regulator with XRE-family HTH domain
VIGFGSKLRLIRQQWDLSLRQVARRSSRLAEEYQDPSYHLSAGWLARLEKEQHEVTVKKLLSLSKIYGISAEQLLSWIRPTAELSISSSPSATVLLTDVPPRSLISETSDHRPDRYYWGIIGMRDYTLDPMIPPGSVVQIDTQNKSISDSGERSTEFQRPIYFLLTRSGYACGWCEVDKESDWLTLVPHPLSVAPVRRWKHRTEIEVVGRVVAVGISLRSSDLSVKQP